MDLYREWGIQYSNSEENAPHKECNKTNCRNTYNKSEKIRSKTIVILLKFYYSSFINH